MVDWYQSEMLNVLNRLFPSFVYQSIVHTILARLCSVTSDMKTRVCLHRSVPLLSLTFNHCFCIAIFEYIFVGPVQPQHGMPVLDGVDDYHMIQLVQTVASGESS
jgi:hypothetical protein